MTSQSRTDKALLDTSAVLALPKLAESALPTRSTVSVTTVAELQRGLSTGPAHQRVARRAQFQAIRSLVDVAPFSEEATYYFGQLCGTEVRNGRNPKPRILDLMIAATAITEAVPIVTCNPRDFAAAEGFVPVHGVAPDAS